MRLKNARCHRIRNFGFGSRDPLKALINAIKDGYESFSSIGTVTARIKLFVAFYETQIGHLKDLRDLTKEDVLEYASHLKARLACDKLAVSTAHNRLSAVNRCLELVRGDTCLKVKPIDVGIPKRSRVATEDKSCHLKLTYENIGFFEAFIDVIQELGPRFEECSKLDLPVALKEAKKQGLVKITGGTKGGRPRVVPMEKPSQIKALERACRITSGRGTFIPEDQNYVEFRAWMYANNPYAPFHSYRHFYAQFKYQSHVGFPPPVKLGLTKKEHIQRMSAALNISQDQARSSDRMARLATAEALGHSRIDITSSYCG